MLDPTLYGLLSQIEKDKIVLPAMQRPFVWKEDRIYRLIDSLLRGFPIGAVMLWRTKTIQRYRRISRDIDTSEATKFFYEESPPDDRYLVLDGQQRLTSLYACFRGSYGQKKMYLDVFSGDATDKDPGNEYYDCRFLSASEAEKLNVEAKERRVHYLPIDSLLSIQPLQALNAAKKKIEEFCLIDEKEISRLSDTYLRCASILGSTKSLQVITVDQDPNIETPIEEVLEIFVRINTAGLTLLKSDLLMSLLDLKWHDIQPELQDLVRDINESRPFKFTRDDVLKSLLLSENTETRFDRLVSDRNQVEHLAKKLPAHIDSVRRGWQLLGIILQDDCKIYSERFFRGGHNALLPFVLYLSGHPDLLLADRRKIVLGIYIAIMSGIFGSAEARMGAFARNTIASADSFPIKELCDLTRREYGIGSLEDLLRRQIDITLNIIHGGITPDPTNPDQLQRDHIFPKSRLSEESYDYDQIYHYANFHFLRAVDNLNKSDKPPHEWFRNPGKAPPYTDQDMAGRLLTWEDIEPGNFAKMLVDRGKRVREKAEQLLGFSEEEINTLFEDRPVIRIAYE